MEASDKLISPDGDLAAELIDAGKMEFVGDVNGDGYDDFIMSRWYV